MRFSRLCKRSFVPAIILAVLSLASVRLSAQAKYGHHGDVLLPDPKYTPGTFANIDLPAVCMTKWGKDARHVTPAMKNVAYLEYGAKKTAKSCCEVDHLVSRELGGADELKNLWPQPWKEARMKDVLENWLHKQVCAGKMKLSDAQEAIRADWYAAYLKMEATK